MAIFTGYKRTAGVSKTFRPNTKVNIVRVHEDGTLLVEHSRKGLQGEVLPTELSLTDEEKQMLDANAEPELMDEHVTHDDDDIGLTLVDMADDEDLSEETLGSDIAEVGTLDVTNLNVAQLMAAVEEGMCEDFTPDSTVEQITSKNDNEFLQAVSQLTSERARNAWLIGGIVTHLLRTGRYKQLMNSNVATAKEFVENVMNYGYRNAQYHAAMYTRFRMLNISSDVVERAGTSKCHEILPYLNEDTKDVLVALITTGPDGKGALTHRELQEHLAEHYKEPETVVNEQTQIISNVQTLTAKLLDAQYDVIMDSLELASTIHNIDDDAHKGKFLVGQQLLAICTDWQQYQLAQTPTTEEDILKLLAAKRGVNVENLEVNVVAVAEDTQHEEQTVSVD